MGSPQGCWFESTPLGVSIKYKIATIKLVQYIFLVEIRGVRFYGHMGMIV